MTKPTVEAIMEAIAYSGLWLNPEDQWEHSWACHLHDPEGNLVGTAYAMTAQQAAAQAWVLYWAPTPPVTPGSVPFDIGDDWKFELLPPYTPDEIAEIEAEASSALSSTRRHGHA